MTQDFADDEAERIFTACYNAVDGDGDVEEYRKMEEIKDIAQALRKAYQKGEEAGCPMNRYTPFHRELTLGGIDEGFCQAREAAAKEAETTVSISDQRVVNHIAKKIRQLRPEGKEVK